MNKFRHFICAAVAALTVFAGCEGTEDLGPEKVALDGPSSIELAQSGQQVTLSLTATVDWQVKGYTDEIKAWLTISPDHGKAAKEAQTITITSLVNNDADRTASLEFYGNIMAKAPLTITQKGSKLPGQGTLEYPYNAAEANEVASALAADTPTSNEFYIKGKICSVKECSPKFGNASFYITDDGNDSPDKFYVFQVKYLGGEKISSEDQVKVGDEVIVRAQLVNYKGNTPETQKGGVIVSHNGKVDDGGSGTGDSDYQNAPAKTVAEVIALADESAYYKLTGTVSGFNSQYCSFDLEDSTGKIYVYSVADKADWKDKIANGDKVTLAGKYLWYEHATDPSKNKHEIVDAYILSVEKGEAPDYQNAPAKTVADFIKAADASAYYKLEGQVTNYNATQCRFDLTDATGTIYVYSVANSSEWSDKLAAGGTVVLAGKYDYYGEPGSGKEEVVDAYIISFKAGDLPPVSVTHPLTSNAKWSLGNKSYDEKVIINGTEYAALKLGTSSVIGEATITDLESAKSLSFFAVSWNNKDGQLEILDGDKVIRTISPARNSAANNNSPYKFENLADSDWYTVEISGVKSLSVRTVASKTRVILFGINAE